MRKKLLIGNWKMNKTIAEALDFAKESDRLVDLAIKKNIDIGVTPTYLSISKVRENSNSALLVGAQNVHMETSGAYTGEISIPMLEEINVNICLTGHSERRTYDNETSLKCAQKNKALIKSGIVPVYCVGETLEQFEQGLTKEVVKTQVIEGLSTFKKECCCSRKVVIAYEPVWSIGTGKNASKEIAEDICGFIREVLEEVFTKETAQEIRILYGGSVKPDNIKEYLAQPNVDGALVGGASLKVDSYIELINNSN